MKSRNLGKENFNGVCELQPLWSWMIRTESFSKREINLGSLRDEFNVVECQGCGLLYINPRPTQEEMGKFYPETYSWKETLEADSFLTKWVRRLEKGYRYHLLKDEVSKVCKVYWETVWEGVRYRVWDG